MSKNICDAIGHQWMWDKRQPTYQCNECKIRRIDFDDARIAVLQKEVARQKVVLKCHMRETFKVPPEDVAHTQPRKEAEAKPKLPHDIGRLINLTEGMLSVMAASPGMNSFSTHVAQVAHALKEVRRNHA